MIRALTSLTVPLLAAAILGRMRFVRLFVVGVLVGVLVVGVHVVIGLGVRLTRASRLQLAWSMVVLRPNSVSIGCRLKQFDLTPQSPQPSRPARRS